MSMSWAIVTAVVTTLVTVALIPIQGLALPLMFEATGHPPPERRDALITAGWIAAVTLGVHLVSIPLVFASGLGMVMLIVDIAIAGTIVHRRHGLEPVDAGKIGAGLYLVGVVVGAALTLALSGAAMRLLMP